MATIKIIWELLHCMHNVQSWTSPKRGVHIKMPILMQKCTIMLVLAIILNYSAKYKHEILLLVLL